MRKTCTLTIFEILLFKGRLVLGPAKQVLETGKVDFSVINQRIAWLLLAVPKNWLPFKLRRFQMTFKPFFFQSFNLSKFFSMKFIKKLFNIKMLLWGQCSPSLHGGYCCSKVGRYCHLHKNFQGGEWLKFQWKTKNISAFLELFWKWLCYKAWKFGMVLFKGFN